MYLGTTGLLCRLTNLFFARGSVDGHQKIDHLFNELERLARTLKTSSDTLERRELLRDMRLTLEEADGLILPKLKSANS
jgi:hypothetical protein